jgi:hypothetical protein
MIIQPLTAVGWLAFSATLDFTITITRVVTVLVIACPMPAAAPFPGKEKWLTAATALDLQAQRALSIRWSRLRSLRELAWLQQARNDGVPGTFGVMRRSDAKGRRRCQRTSPRRPSPS